MLDFMNTESKKEDGLATVDHKKPMASIQLVQIVDS